MHGTIRTYEELAEHLLTRPWPQARAALEHAVAYKADRDEGDVAILLISTRDGSTQNPTREEVLHVEAGLRQILTLTSDEAWLTGEHDVPSNQIRCDSCGKASTSVSRVVIETGYNRADVRPLYNCPDCYAHKYEERLRAAGRQQEADEYVLSRSGLV